MRYKHLQNANVDISEMAVGTWAIGSDGYDVTNTEDSVKAMRTMIDNGVNIIDTAPCYGWGKAEIITKQAIQGYDRSKLLISTKCGLVPNAERPFGGPRPGSGRDASYKNIMREIAMSCSLLGTDYIDFYFVHHPDPLTDLAETMAALNVLRERGLIRFVGFSNHSIEQVEEAMKWGKVDVIQPPFNMLDRSAEPLMKWCFDRGIDNFTYGSLGSGLLTGAIRENPTFGKGDPRGSFYSRLYSPENFEKCMTLLGVMDKIAAEHGKPVVQVAINWSCQHPIVGCILVGVKNEQEALENCAALDWKLSDEEIALLNKTLDELKIDAARIVNR